MKYQFKSDFKWGGASSGPQSEGTYEGDGKMPSLWDHWFEQEPEKFFDGVGPGVASDFYHNYKEIIANMRKAGVKSYRTSIQWSRMIKDCEGTINQQGVDFYNRIIDELIANDIEPMLCLYHFDMPMYWMEKGGFENRDTALAFAEYAAVCFSLFGDRVSYWSTFNEPIVVVEGSYLYKYHYPCICDAKKAALVAVHMQLASSLSVEKFHESGACGKIGIILNLTPSYCKNPESKEDQRASYLSDLICNRSFLDPSVKGEYPADLVELLKEEGILPEVSEEDLETIRQNTVDYIGVNYYHPKRVTARMTAWEGPLMPEKYFEEYVFEGQKMNKSRGWEIYEKGLYDIAVNVRDNYGNIPWYVSENGMGIQQEEQFMDEEGIVQDDYRIQFITDHLIWLHKGIKEGSNCFGYHLWAPFDCWSWTNAYKNRYGLIRVDVKDGCKLSIKKSGAWFKKLSETSMVECE